MGDSEKEQPFSPLPKQTDNKSVAPMVMGAVLVLIAIVGFMLAGRAGKSAGKADQSDPNIAKIQVSDLHMATAQNFAGSSVTYIEGRLTNHSDRTLNAARVQVIFKNAIGEIAQDEKSLLVTVLLPNRPYVDYGPLDLAPIAPAQTRNFRLTLEHVSADWDGQVPQVKLVSVGY
ncbi:MAG: hypothetical protein WA738_07360 [Candidatus Angelobacter sp.]